jgi:hypothetical protein
LPVGIVATNSHLAPAPPDCADIGGPAPGLKAGAGWSSRSPWPAAAVDGTASSSPTKRANTTRRISGYSIPSAGPQPPARRALYLGTIRAVEASADSTARFRLVAFALALLVVGALVLVAVLAAGGSGDDEPGLAVERLAAVGGGSPELVFYVRDRAKNVPATTGGKRSVTAECLDEGGKVLFRGRQAWPFGYPDGKQLDPHVHQPVSRRDAALVTRCRLKGTSPELAGEVGEAAAR